jgi:hypothetical protein
MHGGGAPRRARARPRVHAAMLRIGAQLVVKQKVAHGEVSCKLEWESLSQCPTLIFVAGHPLEPAQKLPINTLLNTIIAKILHNQFCFEVLKPRYPTSCTAVLILYVACTIPKTPFSVPEIRASACLRAQLQDLRHGTFR